MTGQEIKESIDKNNDKIESLMELNKFILNNEIADLIQHNRNLQGLCVHEFENGYCKYCYTEEK